MASNPSNHILAVPRCSYFIALLDYGPKAGIGPSMLSCDPEATRADIVAEVRDHIASDRCIVHVKHVNGTDFEDITAEVLAEAMQEREPPSWEEIGDKLNALRDHFSDLRKHEAV
jgi:hypothetical protein